MAAIQGGKGNDMEPRMTKMESRTTMKESKMTKMVRKRSSWCRKCGWWVARCWPAGIILEGKGEAEKYN